MTSLPTPHIALRDRLCARFILGLGLIAALQLMYIATHNGRACCQKETSHDHP